MHVGPGKVIKTHGYIELWIDSIAAAVVVAAAAKVCPAFSLVSFFLSLRPLPFTPL